jgi:hypothetical protein
MYIRLNTSLIEFDLLKIALQVHEISIKSHAKIGHDRRKKFPDRAICKKNV